MISERKLVSAHSSFWRVTMPMADAFLRSMNTQVDRFALPVPSRAESSRNAFVSELAFRLFADSLEGRASLDLAPTLQQAYIEQASEEVGRYIARLDRGGAYLVPNSDELAEAFVIATRLDLAMRIYERQKPVRARPTFTGCGVIDDCEGDLLVGETLYEVKNVERPFRIADIRQLLCYCALNLASREHTIESVGLLNGRLGLIYRIGLNPLCLASAGLAAVPLLSEIVSYIAVDRPSR